MTKAILTQLVADADLVADVGVRLGRIKNVEFLTVLSKARQALENNVASPSVVEELQKSLNIVINDIYPITLNDLRSGWRLSNAQPANRLGIFIYRLGIFIFGLFCFFLLVFTAYVTLLYDQAVSLYATTLELQDIRGAEQTIRLFGLLRKNRNDVVDAVRNSFDVNAVKNSGNKDFLYEAFNKALFDLQLMNVRFQAYGGIAAKLLLDLDIFERLRNIFSFKNISSVDVQNPTNDPRISAWLPNYGQHPSPQTTVWERFFGFAFSLVVTILGFQENKQAPVSPVNFDNLDLSSLLNIYFKEIRNFTTTINVGFDPLEPPDYSYFIYRFRQSINVFGLWLLPGLYGMLGAVIFHIRKLLDPNLPNPSSMRFAYRILLGGFAGIILIWFWTPSSPKLSQPAFATLTSFGLAFLIGFSTDVFFQALDRFVSHISQTIGQTGT